MENNTFELMTSNRKGLAQKERDERLQAGALPHAWLQPFAALETAAAAEPLIWLHAPHELTAELLPLLRAHLDAGHNRCFLAGYPTAEHSSFAPLRPLLRQLLPLVKDGVAEILYACAPELVALLPDLASSLLTETSELATLVHMPLHSDRTLPLDSDYVYRIAMRAGWFLENAGRHYTAASQRRPVFVFPCVEKFDRPTLQTLYHLCWRARTGAFRLVIISACAPDTGPIDESLGLFDLQHVQQTFLSKLYERLKPALVRLPATVPNQPSLAPLPAGDDSEACAYRLAVTALGTAPLEEAQLAFFHAVEVSTQYLNAQPVLSLAAEALAREDLEIDGEFVASIWHTAGMAHASHGDYTRATDCFRRGFARTHQPVMRARLAMFLSLVLAKRMGQFEEAEHFLATGYSAIESAETPEATLEHGWLNNVKALIAYRNRDYGQALRLTQSALEFMKPYRTPASISLNTNLVANASVVFETTGKCERALGIWGIFRTFLDEAGDVFGKYYYLREAGLQLKAGLIAEATRGYQQAFAMAKRVGDLVTMEAAARASSQIAGRAGDYASALTWAERLPALLEQIGDQQQLYQSWLAIAACHALQTHPREAEAALCNARLLLERDNRLQECPDLLDALTRLQAGQADAIDWQRWLPALPHTMLRGPSHLFQP
ncbi:MAG TPA: hypothetical protein VF458_04845 [Ktedonobacteraceae bacterium]